MTKTYTFTLRGTSDAIQCALALITNNEDRRVRIEFNFDPKAPCDLIGTISSDNQRAVVMLWNEIDRIRGLLKGTEIKDLSEVRKITS